MSHWETGPARTSSAPDDWPEPVGDVTTWRLRTPAGEPVGTLRWNEGGLSWEFASGVGLDAQAHGAEMLQFLRGMRAEGVDLAQVVEMIGAAYAGDLDES